MLRKVIVDSGNTSNKVGLFEGDQLMEVLHLSSTALVAFLQTAQADALLLSSVADTEEVINEAKNIPRKWILTSQTPVPVRIAYETPQTLGVDRLAAVCGARELFPQSNCLVIDAGTCVTYELLTAEGVYLGGAISPGLQMRLKAMHHFTARLPEVVVEPGARLIGVSTSTCLQTGALFGLTAEMNGLIEQYAGEFPELKVILCGGDTRFFENRLKPAIFALPELVLSGLNSILNYNVRFF